MWFTDVLWPDFTLEHLHQALASFAARERRFGGR
jgi:undecaprenyl diphosphate synthase